MITQEQATEIALTAAGNAGFRREEFKINRWVIEAIMQGALTVHPPTLRDQFAMHVLSGMLANDNHECAWPVRAKSAYELADMMMAAR